MAKFFTLILMASAASQAAAIPIGNLVDETKLVSDAAHDLGKEIASVNILEDEIHDAAMESLIGEEDPHLLLEEETPLDAHIGALFEDSPLDSALEELGETDPAIGAAADLQSIIEVIEENPHLLLEEETPIDDYILGALEDSPQDSAMEALE